MAKLITVFWCDIPAQVIAQSGRGKQRDSAKVELSDRFIKAIDSAAMHDGSVDADTYLGKWRRTEPIDCGEDLNAEARAFADRIESEYDAERLRSLIESGGIAG